MPETPPPAYFWMPPRVGSYGDEAIDLTAMCGRILDEDQKRAVDAQLSYGPGGRWATFESAVVEARQNGKTGGKLLPVVLFDLFLLPPDKIVWTSHRVRTTRDAFLDFRALIDGTGYLSRRVKNITSGHDEMAIELHSGARLEFLARSEGDGRGLGGKRIVLDEALFLAGQEMGALLPLLAARSISGDPQVNYASSAALVRSDHLRALRDRGRAGGDPSLVWIEHCAPGSWDDPGCQLGPECPHTVDVAGCVLDDETLWPLANPALRRRISVDYVRKERRALPPEEFGRERYGWHQEPPKTAGKALLQAWSRCADERSAPASRPVLVIDVDPQSASASITAAMLRPDGLPHLEVIEHRPGSDWVVGRAAQLNRHRPLDWLLDPSGPAGALLPDLATVGIEPRLLTARDLGQACEAFLAAVLARALRHLADPVLARAIKGADRRDIGDGLWAWSRRKSTTAISALVAVTIALWGLSVVPPPQAPTPPPRVARMTGEQDSSWGPDMTGLDTAGF